jgi:hypothetical protein
MLPIDPRTHEIAHYYRALSAKIGTAATCFCLPGHWSTEGVRSLLERLADNASAEYKPRILLGLGGCYGVSNHLEESGEVWLEAARMAVRTDVFSRCGALRMLALVRSLTGDHAGSLADLERLYPLVRSLSTSYAGEYHEYLNNLAYELGHVGRVEEAKAAIKVALRSPYAHRFPDWSETAQELETKPRRAFPPFVVAIGGSAETADRLQSKDSASLNVGPEARRTPPVESERNELARAASVCGPAAVGCFDAALKLQRSNRVRAGSQNPSESQKLRRKLEPSVAERPWCRPVRVAIACRDSSARAPPGCVETKRVKTYIHTNQSVSASCLGAHGLRYRCFCASLVRGGSGPPEKAKVEVCSTGARAPPCAFSSHVHACQLTAARSTIVRDQRARGPPCLK